MVSHLSNMYGNSSTRYLISLYCKHIKHRQLQLLTIYKKSCCGWKKCGRVEETAVIQRHSLRKLHVCDTLPEDRLTSSLASDPIAITPTDI